MKQVTITAETRVRVAKTVQMTDADFKRYEAMLDSDGDIDRPLARLADKYGLELTDCPDQDEWENVTVEPEP